MYLSYTFIKIFSLKKSQSSVLKMLRLINEKAYVNFLWKVATILPVHKVWFFPKGYQVKSW